MMCFFLIFLATSVDAFYLHQVNKLNPQLNALWFSVPQLTIQPAGWAIRNPINISVPYQDDCIGAQVTWNKTSVTSQTFASLYQKSVIFTVSSWGEPFVIGLAFVFE